MLSFIDKGEMREIAIFKLLFDENRIWTLDELSLQVNCSIESTSAAIQNLTEMSVTDYPHFDLTVQPSKGISMTIKPGCSYRMLRGVYLEKALAFQILDVLFQSPTTTINQLVNQFFVSKSSIYRKLKKIQEILEECNISFNTATLKISGDELLIREFFYYLYMKISRTTPWPFKSVPKQLLEQRLGLISSQILSPLSPADKNKWLVRLGINFIRQTQKKFIQDVDSQLIDPYRRNLYQPLLKEFISALPSEVQQKELDSLLLILSSYPVLFDNNVTNTMIIDWHQKESTIAYQLTHEIISALEKKYANNPFVATTNTIFLVLCISIYAVVDKDLLLQDPAGTEEYLGLLNSHPELMSNLEDVISSIDFQNIYQLPERNNPYLIYSIYTILSLEYDTRDFENVLLIRIASSVHTGYEIPLKKQLLAKTQRHIIVHTTIDSLASNVEYDLAIYDYTPESTNSSKTSNKASYIWEYPPSNRNWEDVLQLIDTASYSNKTH